MKEVIKGIAVIIIGVLLILILTVTWSRSPEYPYQRSKSIGLDRLQEINYIFEAHEREEIEVTRKEIKRLIKEFDKIVKSGEWLDREIEYKNRVWRKQ